MSDVKGDKQLGDTRRKRKQNEMDRGKRLLPVLSPPYAQKWPQITKKHHKMVMSEIEEVFKTNLTDQSIAHKYWRLKKRHPEYTAERIEELLISIFSRRAEYSEKDLPRLISSLNDPSKIQNKKQLSKYVVIGTRDVTRHLEHKHDLYIVLCCSSGEMLIHENILCLALLSDTPVCALDHLSDLIAPLIDFRYVGVIGFKKMENSPFKDLAEFIADKIPDVETPWIHLWKEKLKGNVENPDGELATRTVECGDNSNYTGTVEENRNVDGTVDITHADDQVEVADIRFGSYKGKIKGEINHCGIQTPVKNIVNAKSASDWENKKQISNDSDIKIPAKIAIIPKSVAILDDINKQLTSNGSDLETTSKKTKLITSVSNYQLNKIDQKNNSCKKEVEYLEMNINWKEVKLRKSNQGKKGKKEKQ